jgi:hypothetical protein
MSVRNFQTIGENWCEFANKNSVSASNRWDAFWRWEVIRHDPDLVISKERQRLRNLFPVAQDFSLALEMTEAWSV